MGIEQPVNEYMEAGKVAHKIVTDHVCGIKKDPRVTLDLQFTNAEYKCFTDYRDNYSLYGFCDAVSFKSKSIMEYKTSSKPWSQQRFDDLIQIPYYSLATNFRKIFMVTSTAQLENFKVFYKEINEADIQKAKDFIEQGIAIIEKGDFRSDLIDGKCDGSCNYGPKCYFAATLHSMYKSWEVPSKSVPGKNYIVREYKGKLRCSCKRFVFTQKCKHADLLLQKPIS